MNTALVQLTSTETKRSIWLNVNMLVSFQSADTDEFATDIDTLHGHYQVSEHPSEIVNLINKAKEQPNA